MAKFRFSKLKAPLILVLIAGAAWALQHFGYREEIILIDGKQASVIDGDSFRIADSEYRIYGIDAPEYRQTCLDQSNAEWACGKAARQGLDARLRGHNFSCEAHARDQFGRTIVTCLNDRQVDLGSSLVDQGLAISGQYFDENFYVTEEARAKTAKRGIWRGTFTRPDVWRAEHPRK